MTQEFDDLDLPEFDFQALQVDNQDDKPDDSNPDQNPDLEGDNEDDVDGQGDQTTDDDSSGYVKTAYELLSQFGILEEDEEFDNTEEALTNKLNELPSKILQATIQQLPTSAQKLLQFVAEAKEDLTVDEIDTFVKSLKSESTTLTFDTQDEAREFLEKQLTSQGLSKRAIQAELDELEENEELIDRAKKVYNALPKKTDQMIESKQQNNAAKVKQQREFYSAVQQELEAMNWKKAKQQQILNTAPKVNETLNQVGASPKAYVQLLDFLTKFNGKEFDLSDYIKKGETKAASAVKSILEKNQVSSSTSKTSGTASTIDSILKNFSDRYEPVV